MDGEISYSPDTEQPFNIGTVALHECNPGFTRVGPETRTCVEDDFALIAVVGIFTGSPPTCQCKEICMLFKIFIQMNICSLLYLVRIN